jgi:N-alpha-acetyltransferase 50
VFPSARAMARAASSSLPGLHGAADPPLPVVWSALTEQNVGDLRRLNAAVFPVRYNDKFYRDALAAPPDLIRLAYVGNILAGTVCCRLEESDAGEEEGPSPPHPPHAPQPTTSAATLMALNVARSGDGPPRRPRTPGAAKLYIMTLGVLAAYRERGVGGQLIRHVMNTAQHSPDAAGVTEVYLHVQVGNDDALSFYSHHGFSVKTRLVNYYRKIHPADCFYVHRTVSRRGDDTRGGGAATRAGAAEHAREGVVVESS